MSSGILISRTDIFEAAGFASCHAATLVETDRGILAAWFGGTREGAPDVGVYTARLVGNRWSEPEQVADGAPYPCWNPVLFRPIGGPIMLFYKVGPNPREWWGMVRTSCDHGQTWSAPRRLPNGLLGPIKNKPVQLPTGRIISPSSREWSAAADPHGGAGRWGLCFEISDDGGESWRATPMVPADKPIAAIQPSILVHSSATLQAIGRTRSSGRLCETWSQDAGDTWSPLRLMSLPNCNSGVDALTRRGAIADARARHLLVYNHSNVEKVRYPLNLAVSPDGCHWLAGIELEHEPPGQYSYPAMIETSAGLVHVCYTWKRRRIRHAVIDADRIEPRPIEVFRCPPPGSPTHRVDPEQ